jgi:hypothetical protein
VVSEKGNPLLAVPLIDYAIVTNSFVHSCPIDECSYPSCTVSVNSLVSSFNDQTIFQGSDPVDASYDLNRLISGVLRTNDPAQLNSALAGFHTDPE